MCWNLPDKQGLLLIGGKSGDDTIEHIKFNEKNGEVLDYMRDSLKRA